MGMTNDPDQTALMDIAMARRSLTNRLAADGELCRQDRAALAALDAPVKGLSVRHNARKALEACLRNGLSYYTRTMAKDAGIAFVACGEQVTNVIAVSETEKHPDRGNDQSAA